MDGVQAALVEVLQRLDQVGYDFVTPTPSTVRRWGARPPPTRPALRDIFGWGFRFRRGDITPGLFEALSAAGALAQDGDRLSCRLRVARVQERLLLHSAFPGAASDAVFIGPDSYRFAALIGREISKGPARRILDIGTGAGVGAVLAGAWSPGAQVFGSDVNPAALRLAGANAAHAGVTVAFHLAEGLAEAPDDLDLVIANPPYVAGESGRTYKDGGGELGERLALDWTRAALRRLTPGGRVILYTGAPIRAGGQDVIREGLEAIAAEADLSLSYEELDPDVFAGELRRTPYQEVERIAAIGAVIQRPA